MLIANAPYFGILCLKRSAAHDHADNTAHHNADNNANAAADHNANHHAHAGKEGPNDSAGANIYGRC
jgi:hypothetical protein